MRRNDLHGADSLASAGESEPGPGSGLRAGTYDEIAHQLTDGYWGGTRWGPLYDAATGDTLTADITALPAAGQQLARWTLEAWTNVSGIQFRFVSGEADITFLTDAARPTSSWLGHVNIHPNQFTNTETWNLYIFLHEIGHALGLGHAGDYPQAGRSGYADTAKFLNDSYQSTVMSYFSQEDNTYVDASFASPVTPMIADIIAIQELYGVPAGSNAGDTVYGYGSNVGGYLGALFGALSGEAPNPYIDGSAPLALTLYDTGGNDTLDMRWDAGDQRVDLRPEGISDVLGLTGNLVMARDTVIENFVAGSGHDEVAGNDAANHLQGRRGNDTLRGGPGDDRLAGGPGHDRLAGGPGADAMDGGAGRDLLSYEGSDTGVSVNLAAGTGSGGDAAGDTFENVEGVVGSAHGDTLTGSAGNDWLAGKGGDDVLVGGAGNDGLAGGPGADVMDGGAGHDWLWYGGSAAGVVVDLQAGTFRGGDAEGDTVRNVEQVVGSAHADTLAGGDGDDWLSGRDGDDVLDGRAGNDGLVGSGGADRLRGGPGHDRIWYGGSDAGVAVDLSAGTASGGHAEGDTFENVEGVGGSRYADTLFGGSGNDWLGGGAGDDWLAGRAGADRLEGGAGGDTASYAGSDAAVQVHLAAGTASGGHAAGDTLVGIEHLVGSAHADALGGNAAGNRLAGGAGNDRLFGDQGDDTLTGGAGGDRLDGGGGADTASYAGSDAAVQVHLATGAGSGGHAAGDTLVGIEHLEGSAHADTLSGHDGDNRLRGGAGADRLDGGAGNDWLSYAGSDAGVTVYLGSGMGRGGHAEGDVFRNVEGIVGSGHADSLGGGGGNDTLDGGAGVDALEGGAGDDVLTGGPGHDALWGDGGNDTLDGGSGDDRLRGGAGADWLDGGAGDYDSLSYYASDAGVAVNLATGTAGGGHAEGDTFRNVEIVYGSGHADLLTGGGGDDTLWGDGGSDTLDGGAGRDWLRGGDGDDLLTGGSGDDRLWGDDGNDTLGGGAGHDRLDGGDGDDVLTGGSGDDVLTGAAGGDRLDGGDGTDTVSYTTSDAGVAVNLSAGTGRGGHATGDTVRNVANIQGSEHADTLTGDSGSNSLRGFGGNDALDGGAARDRLFGGDGDDVLTGGGDRDRLWGDGGNDTLDGGAGHDVLYGGDGDDVFRFGDGDTIVDFVAGSDRIDLSEFGVDTGSFDAQVAIRQSGENVEVVLENAVLMLLEVSAADITAADFVLA